MPRPGLALIAALTPALAALAPAMPWTLTWTEGRCLGCRTAAALGHIEFLDRTHAWAIGHNNGTRGPGNAIVVRTADGGRTWRELPESAQDRGGNTGGNRDDTAGPPAFFFLDSLRGWISAALSFEDPAFSATFDGGENWRETAPVALRSVRFFDPAHGCGLSAAPGAAAFRCTSDGGFHWTERTFAGVRALDRMFFLDRDRGWIAGTGGSTLRIFATTDAGRTWRESAIRTTPDCEGVRDLFFLDSRYGWLVAWYASGGGARIFATADGGRSWNPLREPAFQGKSHWITSVRFLSPGEGFVFEKSDTAERNLFYTADGGATWSKQPIPQPVDDCQIFSGDLLCSAGEEPDGFEILTLQRGAR